MTIYTGYTVKIPQIKLKAIRQSTHNISNNSTKLPDLPSDSVKFSSSNKDKERAKELGENLGKGIGDAAQGIIRGTAALTTGLSVLALTGHPVAAVGAAKVVDSSIQEHFEKRREKKK